MMFKRLILVFTVFAFNLLWSSAQFNKQENLKAQRLTGSALVNYYIQYEGTPFFNEDWRMATVRLSGGEIYENLQVKLDIHKDYLVVNNTILGRNIVLDKDIVDEIYIENNKGEERILVKNICIPTENDQAEYSFYFIQLTDSISLWSKKKKNLFKSNSTSASKSGYFQYQSRYFLVVNGEMTHITLMKRSLARKFPANKKTILSFIRQNRLDLKNDRHLILLFKMINEWEKQNPSSRL